MMARIASDVLLSYRVGRVPRYEKLTTLIARWIRRKILYR